MQASVPLGVHSHSAHCKQELHYHLLNELIYTTSPTLTSTWNVILTYHFGDCMSYDVQSFVNEALELSIVLHKGENRSSARLRLLTPPAASKQEAVLRNQLASLSHDGCSNTAIRERQTELSISLET